MSHKESWVWTLSLSRWHCLGKVWTLWLARSESLATGGELDVTSPVFPTALATCLSFYHAIPLLECRTGEIGAVCPRTWLVHLLLWCHKAPLRGMVDTWPYTEHTRAGFCPHSVVAVGWRISTPASSRRTLKSYWISADWVSFWGCGFHVYLLIYWFQEWLGLFLFFFMILYFYSLFIYVISIYLFFYS